MRTSKTFAGYDDMKRLANGIVEDIVEMIEDDQELDEVWKGPSKTKSKETPKKCFTGPQLFQLRQKIFNQLMNFISTYEDAKKASKKS
jgi:hypothetical protein